MQHICLEDGKIKIVQTVFKSIKHRVIYSHKRSKICIEHLIELLE